MTMDASHFPIVWMTLAHEPGHDHEQDFIEFERLLNRNQRFVMLSDKIPSNDHQHDFTERKRTTLWMKRHRMELRRLVGGLIIIEQNDLKRRAIEAFTIVFAKFWGYPLLLARDKEQAMAIAEKLLGSTSIAEPVSRPQ
jgi:hypothetical protein